MIVLLKKDPREDELQTWSAGSAAWGWTCT